MFSRLPGSIDQYGRPREVWDIQLLIAEVVLHHFKPVGLAGVSSRVFYPVFELFIVTGQADEQTYSAGIFCGRYKTGVLL